MMDNGAEQLDREERALHTVLPQVLHSNPTEV